MSGSRTAALVLGLAMPPAMLASSHLARGQSIQTVAGGGPIGDGRPATLAFLGSPVDVALDAAGNLFVSEGSNHRVRRVDAATSVIATYAGGGTSGLGDGGPATAANVTSPEGLAVDRSGNLFVFVGGLVRMVDARTGVITTVAGGGGPADHLGDGGPATQALLQGGPGLEVDSAGNLFVGEAGRVRKVSAATGVITTVAGSGTLGFSGDGGPATAASLNQAADVVVDAAGNLYIADQLNHRVRKVAAGTGIISTVAGNGEDALPPGDGGPATLATVAHPNGLALDSAGNLYIGSGVVRRVDATTGVITTVAGGGNPADGLGDGGPATQARLAVLIGMRFDAADNLYVASFQTGRVRRIAAASGIITTVAGGGPIGDGGPATAALLAQPYGLAFDASGNLYVADLFHHFVRRVAAGSGVITAVAGTGKDSQEGDGGPATAASVGQPRGVAFDVAGNLLVAGDWDRVRRIDARTGIVTTVAGGGNPTEGLGDGGPATRARINGAEGVAIDAAGNLFVAERWNHRIRRVAADTGIITTFAGSGPTGTGQQIPGSFSGDGGPATAAGLNEPLGVAVNRAGTAVYIADTRNSRVRRVDVPTGIITTVAGDGTRGSSGDGGPATAAPLNFATSVALDTADNVFVGVYSGVRRVDARTGIISTVAGGGALGFAGDFGPATLASMNGGTSGLVLDSAGNLFLSDSGNNRVRAVYACVEVAGPVLTSPEDSARDVPSAPTLTWSKVAGAFRYDLYLDVVDPPRAVVAADLTSTAFTPSNLVPGTRFTWKVVAKGDPYCEPQSTASSAVRSFTTAGTCGPPGSFDSVSPADAVSEQPASLTLTWQPSSGASSYDVYLGPSSPPTLYRQGLTQTSLAVTGLASGTTYSWFVVAHAVCDTGRVTFSPTRTFKVTGACLPAGAFTLTSPSDATTIATTATTLIWSASANAGGYDLYFGTTAQPTFYLSDLSGTSATVSGLTPGRTYYWQVVAKVACDSTKSYATPVASFRVEGTCNAPPVPSFTFIPPGKVSVGQTYVVGWRDVGLDPGGGYIVERSNDALFASVLDAQAVTATFASFVSQTPGLYHHRVRSVAGCDPGKRSANSEVRSVEVVVGSPNVVFTVQPQAVITTLGQKLEDRVTRFTLENIGVESILVLLGKAEIGSVPFFTIVDPMGEDAVFVSLEPRKPKTLEVHYSGPPNDRPNSYQGIIFASAAGQAVTPYAFVNLKVGGAQSETPRFRVAGTEAEYAYFPGLSGDDGSRPPITVEIQNPGATPMELGAEIGPEVWLVPESGWNATPIPPGASRTVNLYTKRSRAPNGSALPRYTYLTVRTKDGQTARLLVQDNDASAVSLGRASQLEPAVRSYVIPSVVRATSAIGNTFVSKVRLSNAGSDAIPAELIFTPANADGFDPALVRRAVVLVPPNDVVTLTDPLVQLYGLVPPVSGQLEVRGPADRVGLMTVTSSVDAPARSGGTFGFQMPTVQRGEGAARGSPHLLSGISATESFRTNLILAETTGRDGARVRAVLYDNQGSAKGETAVDVPRYGQKQISGVVGQLGGGASLQAGRLELTVESGGGAVAGIVTFIDNTNDDAVTYVSRPTTPAVGFTRRLGGRTRWALATGTVKLAIPAVVSGFPTFPGTEQPYSFRSLMGFTSATLSPASFRLTYHDLSSGQSISRTVTVTGRQTIEYPNVVEELFAVPAGQRSQGPVFVEADPNGVLYCKVYSNLERGTLGDAFPVVPVPAENLTGGGEAKPVYVDGLEQSTDATRGTRTNLLLNEVAGRPATVTVRLYEAGNRTQPIAEREVALAPLEKVQLSTVFGGMGLSAAERSKDRTNVQCVVTATGGDGLVSAVVTTIDNRTGDTRNSLLTPSGGVPAPGGSIGF